tara:strand:+ start:1078 stop:1788 length:711 start_codon:yes stop_codon:yes gene_type:complete
VAFSKNNYLTTENKRGFIMTIFTIADDILNTIASNEKEINTLKVTSSETGQKIGSLKLSNYAYLISGIAPAKLTSKSNLNSGDRTSLKAELIEFAGLTDSMADKMIKNAVGARNVFQISGSNITPEGVAEIFEVEGITSEAKLIKAVSGDDKKDKVQLVVDKVAGKRSTKKDAKGNRVQGDAWLGGFDYDDIEVFKNKLEDALRIRAEMEKAASVAADNQQAENDAVNSIADALAD